MGQQQTSQKHESSELRRRESMSMPNLLKPPAPVRAASSTEKVAEPPPRNVEAPHFLTKRQQTLISQTWNNDFESLHALGCRLYEEIFDRAPDARHLFAAVEMHGDDWKTSKEFHAQGLRFVQVLSLAVARVGNVEFGLNPMLRDVGFRHRKFTAKGFRPELWDVFRETMHKVVSDQTNSEDSTLSDKDKETLIAGWKLLSEHIIEQMRVGFYYSPKVTVAK